MMTNSKLSLKMHLFIIISCIIIVAGMALGTVFHFVSNEFFNYGSEFADYKCITVNYLTAEKNEEQVKEICNDALSGITIYNISSSDESNGGQVTYKFTYGTDTVKLESAVAKINEKLTANEGLSCASLHEATTYVGGSKVLIFTSIALASAVVAQFLYFILRYKLAAAFSALLANIHNFALYVSLLALTRVPLGIVSVAVGAFVVLVTMLASGIYFDRIRRNAKSPAFEKADQSKVIDASFADSAKLNSYLLIALEVSVLILAVFAIIALAHYTTLWTFVVALIALISTAYGCLFFVPSVHPSIVNATQKLFAHFKQKDNK
jgi:preprotein translocase subunit SecF